LFHSSIVQKPFCFYVSIYFLYVCVVYATHFIYGVDHKKNGGRYHRYGKVSFPICYRFQSLEDMNRPCVCTIIVVISIVQTSRPCFPVFSPYQSRFVPYNATSSIVYRLFVAQCSQTTTFCFCIVLPNALLPLQP